VTASPDVPSPAVDPIAAALPRELEAVTSMLVVIPLPNRDSIRPRLPSAGTCCAVRDRRRVRHAGRRPARAATGS